MLIALLISILCTVGLTIIIHNLGIKRGEIRAKNSILDVLERGCLSEASDKEILLNILEELKR